MIDICDPISELLLLPSESLAMMTQVAIIRARVTRGSSTTFTELFDEGPRPTTQTGELMTERHLPLEGCLNLRDLGGYVTSEEREVRWGCLYRSGELCTLTDADIEEVSRMGIEVVVDLRNEWERAARPDRLPPGVELIERMSPAALDRLDPTLEELIAAGDIQSKTTSTSRACTSTSSIVWYPRSG